MNPGRRRFAQSLTGVFGAFVAGAKAAAAPPAPAAAALARTQARLSPAKVTRIRVFYPPNYNPNGPQAFPQSNMVVLVDTDAGITGIGQGGSPDTVRNVARSVIGKNAFDSEMIWQAAFMDGFYSPGKERLHAIGAIDLALWDIKGKALNAPLYQLFGGKAREHIELYATSGLPQGIVPPAEAAAMGLPVIGTQIRGMRQAIAEGETGTMVPVGATVALAEAVGDLVSNPDGRTRFARAARTRAVEHFATDRIVAELKHQYRLGYEPPDGPARFRRIVVRSTRKGVVVRTRSGYVPPS